MPKSLAEVSSKNVLAERLRMSQELPSRVSQKSVLQECLTRRVSLMAASEECLQRVSYKNVPRESPIRVSERASHKSVLTRVS